jgi:cation:H+ antiporter
MLMDILFVLIGLVLLFFGGEGLIKGSVSIARHLKLSNFLISAVVIGFGTSMPEMTVSVGAALKGSPDIAVGNVVGSNIANIILIVSVAALIFPLTMDKAMAKREVIAMMYASVLLCVLISFNIMSWPAGILLLGSLIAYIVYSYVQDKKQVALAAANAPQNEVSDDEKPLKPALAGVFTVGGLALLVVGAKFMVTGSISIARDFGISEAVIGLTLVAVGTSLPELATAVVSAMRRHGDMIIGNIVGSNIFNILAILGVTAVITPINVTGQIADFDIWVMLLVALFLSLLLWFGKTIGRSIGLFMLVVYIIYTAYLYTGSSAPALDETAAPQAIEAPLSSSDGMSPDSADTVIAPEASLESGVSEEEAETLAQ